MGRSGGGGGGHSSGGHGGGHSSSHHSSGGSRGGSSSFGGSHSGFGGGPSHSHTGSRPGGSGFGGPGPGPRPGGPGFGGPGPGPRPGGPGPRHYDRGPGMPPPPPRPGYHRSSLFSSCLSCIIIGFIVIIALISAGTSSVGSRDVSEDNLAEYANTQYDEIFGSREDCLLLVIMETNDSDECQMSYGGKAAYIVDKYMNDLWNAYDSNYNDDLGIQLNGMFTTVANQVTQDGVSPITAEKPFSKSCYRDDLNWVDTRDNLISGAESFYNATGIQSYVLLVSSKTVNKATDKSSGIIKVIIIAIAAIIVILILFKWWKKRVAQKNKEQEDLERTLSTPLQTYGTSDTVDDLKKKYDGD